MHKLIAKMTPERAEKAVELIAHAIDASMACGMKEKHGARAKVHVILQIAGIESTDDYKPGMPGYDVALQLIIESCEWDEAAADIHTVLGDIRRDLLTIADSMEAEEPDVRNFPTKRQHGQDVG